MANVKSGKSYLPVDLLRKEPRLVKPKADEVYKTFAEFAEYADEKDLIPDKFLWMAYISVTMDTYSLWKQDKVNRYLTDTEFQERLEALKKIDDVLESGMSQTLLHSQGNAGNLIFYLKNAFKWTDRPATETEINVRFGGYILPNDGSKDTKKLDDNSDLVMIE